MTVQFLKYDKDDEIVTIVEYENVSDLFRKDGCLKSSPSKMLLDFIFTGKRAEIFVFDDEKKMMNNFDKISCDVSK
jgi:hypothetical protein